MSTVLTVLQTLMRQSSVVQTSVVIVQSIVAHYMPVYVQYGHAFQFMIRLVRVMLASGTLHTLIEWLARTHQHKLLDTTHAVPTTVTKNIYMVFLIRCLFVS